MTTATSPSPVGERARDDIYRDGITACRGAFSTEWADRMRHDVEAAFAEAIARPDGAVGRGPHRYYVEIHPEQFRGFVDLVTHPWVTAVCEAVLGPDYEIVELGFDTPFPGAEYQPWHRDFPMHEVTRRERRLNSLAFNLTAVDTVEEMGPSRSRRAPSSTPATRSSTACSRRRSSTRGTRSAPCASTRSAATSRPARR